MAREWTPEQTAAIYARNTELLVAAAAGSGKTAVLVERIIELITDSRQPVDLDRLLVVTFTNAAAAEMRQRIGEALSERLESEPENQLLVRQLALLPKASITTIHAYCLRVLRSNFSSLGLDPGFRIADPTENEILRAAALEEVIEELYEDKELAESFLLLTEAYLSIKNSKPFYDMIDHIYDFAMSLPEPVLWLREAAERFNLTESFEKTVYAKELVAAGQAILKGILEKYDTMLQLAENDDGGEGLYQLLHTERAAFMQLCGETTYSGFAEGLAVLSFAAVPRVPKNAQPVYRERIRAMRDDVKKTVQKQLSEDLFLLSGEEQAAMLQKLYPQMSCLSEVVCRLMQRYDEKKEEKNLLNYNDLEHGCYRLFVDENGEPTSLAQAEQRRYDEILIDEYQDTSALQEAIFNAIKKEGSMFLVGDVKQSIYRFRNTNPKLFREKKEHYGTEENAVQRKIILSKNFRSRASVLEAVNYVFMRVMSEKTGEITYNEEEMLYPGAGYPEMEMPVSEETELWLAELAGQEEDEPPEAAEAEAQMAAERIAALIESKVQILGREGVRPIAYRDICILMRSTKNNAEIFSKTLSAAGIPCYSEAGGSFLQSTEITVMLSLLKIIDNPHQDIPLLAVLRSQIYAFSADELADIRLADRQGDFFEAVQKRSENADDLGKRLQQFLEQLTLYREQSRVLNTAELVWYLYMQTGFYEAQSTLPGGTLRRLNLRLLYTRAAAFEKTGLKGLYSFISFIDEYQAIGGDYDAARTIGEEQNVVRIMSIHKSKGLEFPVVILAGLGRRFNLQDTRDKVLIHSDWGYGPQYIDTDMGIVYGNGARSVVKQAMLAETLSEEMRILYVAMTRAREKLILLAAVRKLAGKVEKFGLAAGQKMVSASLTSCAGSYLDWILMALLAHPDAEVLRRLTDSRLPVSYTAGGRFHIEIKEADSLFPVQAEAVSPAVETPTENVPLPTLLDYQYAHAAGIQLPTKITVTEVKRRLYEPEPDSVYLYPRPQFLREHSGRLSPAEAGTAMHTVLERLDYGRCRTREEINLQLQELRQQEILSAAEAAAVSGEALLGFMRSTIGERLRRADRVLREVSFGISTEAEPIFEIPGQVMLQGMIDCVLFEGESISILDYKTDRKGTPEELAEQYRVQLDCYARAAERLYGKKVAHRYLYLFHHQQLLEL